MQNEQIRPAKDLAFDYLKTLTPAMRYREGGDFAAWQRAAREKLRELLGMDRFAPCAPKTQVDYERPLGPHTETRFTFMSEANWRVPCVMLTPKGAPKGVMICLQGHSTGMHNSLGRAKYPGDTVAEDPENGDRDFALQAAAHGYIAVALEQRAFGECGGTPRPDCQHAALVSILAGRTLIGQRVWDVQRLINVLKTEFGCSALPFYCMGNSGGGTATFYAACVLPELAGAMPSCSVCTYEDSIGFRAHCACNYIPGIAVYFDMGDLAGLIAPRPYVQVNGKDDPIFLLKGAEKTFALTQKLYAAAGAPDKCRFVVGAEGHRFYAADSWPVFEAVTAAE